MLPKVGPKSMSPKTAPKMAPKSAPTSAPKAAAGGVPAELEKLRQSASSLYAAAMGEIAKKTGVDGWSIDFDAPVLHAAISSAVPANAKHLFDNLNKAMGRSLSSAIRDLSGPQAALFAEAVSSHTFVVVVDDSSPLTELNRAVIEGDGRFVFRAPAAVLGKYDSAKESGKAVPVALAAWIAAGNYSGANPFTVDLVAKQAPKLAAARKALAENIGGEWPIVFEPSVDAVFAAVYDAQPSGAQNFFLNLHTKVAESISKAVLAMDEAGREKFSAEVSKTTIAIILDPQATSTALESALVNGRLELRGNVNLLAKYGSGEEAGASLLRMFPPEKVEEIYPTHSFEPRTSYQASFGGGGGGGAGASAAGAKKTKPCTFCNGTGRPPCHICKGKGCKQRGCGGSGRAKVGNCVKCKGSGSV
jgi:hypothetical protein